MNPNTRPKYYKSSNKTRNMDRLRQEMGYISTTNPQIRLKSPMKSSLNQFSNLSPKPDIKLSDRARITNEIGLKVFSLDAAKILDQIHKRR
jgi:hypothetical protein